MAPKKKKSAAKKAAPAKKSASRSSGKGVNSFIKYAEKNPAVAIVGLIVVGLAAMLLFSYQPQ